MSNIITRLFNKDKALESLDNMFTRTSKGVDNLIFTNEERVKEFTNLLSAYAPFKLAQRLLSLLIGLPFVLVHLVLVICRLYVLFYIENLERSEYLLNGLSKITDSNNETLGLPFSIIVGFYFAGGVANYFKRK